MTAVPVEETTDLTALDWDYAPPCEVKRGEVQCERPANWVVTWRNPLPCGSILASIHSLICDRCLDEFRTKGVSCVHCRQAWTLGRVLVRLRPIGGGHGEGE